MSKVFAQIPQYCCDLLQYSFKICDSTSQNHRKLHSRMPLNQEVSAVTETNTNKFIVDVGLTMPKINFRLIKFLASLTVDFPFCEWDLLSYIFGECDYH